MNDSRMAKSKVFSDNMKTMFPRPRWEFSKKIQILTKILLTKIIFLGNHLLCSWILNIEMIFSPKDFSPKGVQLLLSSGRATTRHGSKLTKTYSPKTEVTNGPLGPGSVFPYKTNGILLVRAMRFQRFRQIVPKRYVFSFKR